MITVSAKLREIVKVNDEIIVQDNEDQKRWHGKVTEVSRNFLSIEKIYPTGYKGSIQFPMCLIDTKEYEIFLKVS